LILGGFEEDEMGKAIEAEGQSEGQFRGGKRREDLPGDWSPLPLVRYQDRVKDAFPCPFLRSRMR